MQSHWVTTGNGVLCFGPAVKLKYDFPLPASCILTAGEWASKSSLQPKALHSQAQAFTLDLPTSPACCSCDLRALSYTPWWEEVAQSGERGTQGCLSNAAWFPFFKHSSLLNSFWNVTNIKKKKMWTVQKCFFKGTCWQRTLPTLSKTRHREVWYRTNLIMWWLGLKYITKSTCEE